MGLSNSIVRQAADHSTLELIKIFQRAPYRFLYEHDLQALLFTKIRDSIPGSISIRGRGHPLNEYELSAVYTEYLKKIDVACVDVESAQGHPMRVHKGMDIHIYELPILIGIEIKYRKLGDRFGIEACVADFDKLKKLNIAEPLVLGFIQSDQDVESFFSAPPSGYNSVEVDIMEPLSMINIVSPTKRWRVDVVEHS